MFKQMKFLLIIFGLLNSTQVFAAYEGCELPEPVTPQMCRLIKSKEDTIMRKKEDLHALQDLQAKILEGKALQERLINSEDTLELINVEEKLTVEMALLVENDGVQIKKAVPSVGGIILFGYIVKRMARNTRGQAMGRRIFSQLFPKEGTLLKTAANAGLIVSLASTFFAGYKLFENHQEKKTLNEMIELLNKIKDQSDNIAALREEIEELETCYWLQVDQLVDLGLAETVQNKLQCF